MSTSATSLDACALCCYKVNQTTSISTNVSKTCCVTSQKSATKTFENLSKVPLKIHMSLDFAATFPWAISLCNLLICSKKVRKDTHASKTWPLYSICSRMTQKTATPHRVVSLFLRFSQELTNSRSKRFEDIMCLKTLSEPSHAHSAYKIYLYT